MPRPKFPPLSRPKYDSHATPLLDTYCLVQLFLTVFFTFRVLDTHQLVAGWGTLVPYIFFICWTLTMLAFIMDLKRYAVELEMGRVVLAGLLLSWLVLVSERPAYQQLVEEKEAGRLSLVIPQDERLLKRAVAT